MKVIVVHVLQNIDYIHVHAHVSISSLILHNTCFNCPDSNVKYSRLMKKKINEEKKIYFKVALLIAKWKKSFLSSFFQQEFKRRCPLSYKICYHACNKHLTPPPSHHYYHPIRHVTMKLNDKFCISTSVVSKHDEVYHLIVSDELIEFLCWQKFSKCACKTYTNRWMVY